jgi:hypothetical protein
MRNAWSFQTVVKSTPVCPSLIPNFERMSSLSNSGKLRAAARGQRRLPGVDVGAVVGLGDDRAVPGGADQPSGSVGLCGLEDPTSERERAIAQIGGSRPGGVNRRLDGDVIVGAGAAIVGVPVQRHGSVGGEDQRTGEVDAGFDRIQPRVGRHVGGFERVHARVVGGQF